MLVHIIVYWNLCQSSSSIKLGKHVYAQDVVVVQYDPLAVHSTPLEHVSHKLAAVMEKLVSFNKHS